MPDLMTEIDALLNPCCWDDLESAMQTRPAYDDVPRIFIERETEEGKLEETATDLETAGEHRPCDYTRMSDIFGSGEAVEKVDPQVALMLEIKLDCDVRSHRMNHPFKPVQGCLPRPKKWGAVKVLATGSGIMLYGHQL